MLNISRSHKRTIVLQSAPPPPPPPKPAPYRVLRVPDDGARYMVLVDDWDTAKWNFKPRSLDKGYKSDPPWNALPATVQTQKLFHALNKEWQLFFFELCKRATGYSVPLDVMLADYKQYSRDSGGWRDQHTWNNWRNERDKVPPDQQKIYTDWVLNLNVPPAHTEGDAAQQDLLSSGNIVKVLGEINDDYIIETLDPYKPPPPIDEIWGKWWLVGFATLSAYWWPDATYPNGKRARLKWPGFGGYGVPHMALGRDGVNRVPKYWCRPIANGAEYSLYT